jgi:UMF1 family MFS transporter
MTRGAVSWSLFEGARNPYVVLVTIYIFAPYVASVMIGDPVKGQAVISQWSQYAGWIIMATAPFPAPPSTSWAAASSGWAWWSPPWSR